ncbi:properdin [Acanthochromis polyacanthus]|uniref:properdin n=1 Tax=Acanthochromis polyacanthus TaxID=80966 RepID=UPI0022342324|nr:properdin [Acanthochromis polyacanthus]
MEVLRVLLVLVLLLGSVQRSECVRCFARFHLSSGQCDEEIGEVDEDDCCQNPKYGYQATDGTCQSCGPPAWSSWSPWSPCNVLCGKGVRQRSRKCFGVGQSECENINDKLQTEPCDGTCCEDQGWGQWLAWSPCSVTCGGVGVRRRERVCSSPPECLSACNGSSQETESCAAHNTCPVHGGWSSWSGWSDCSHSCIDDQRADADAIMPSRMRRRSCSNPAPSNDTAPPGNSCPENDVQKQVCSELPNCPVNGNWGAWSPAGPCSVSCGEGLRLSTRKCDSPAPKYGGLYCEGPSTQSSVCKSPCPVDGFWSGWSNWGECTASCIPQGRAPVRTRRRSCSNPAPSTTPPGGGCQGDNRQVEHCNHLPHCKVDGGWGSWSPFTSCPVTCGVGFQVSIRRCDSPAPQHGGRQCPGEGRRSSICSTNVHCPVDGVWSEWSAWSVCKYPFGDRKITCKQIGGSQSRVRECLHRAHNGSICSGDSLMDRRVCYDVSRCYVKGSWDGWDTWSLCRPACVNSARDNPARIRSRVCRPDYSNYPPTIGRQKEKATFFGTPLVDCGAPPDGGEKYQKEPCLSVPACS